MDFYFVTAGYRNPMEIEIIRELKPKKVLVSFHYFRKTPLEKFIEDIGYLPEIMLDSGAYSAFNTGKNISLVDYMKYVEENHLWIKSFISLDVIGDGEMSWDYYRIMRKKGFNPIPCFHYGDDTELLERYIADGNDYIALGNTVPESDKNKVAWWVMTLIQRYPEIKFHLLGSSSEKILNVKGLQSCDSSTWITNALMGNPKHIKGKTRDAKIQRAKFNMQELIERMVSA